MDVYADSLTYHIDRIFYTTGGSILRGIGDLKRWKQDVKRAVRIKRAENPEFQALHYYYTTRTVNPSTFKDVDDCKSKNKWVNARKH